MARYQAFSATVTGSSHTKHGKECQDYSLEVNTPKGSAALAIVADGHGADECFRSARGAELAAACAKRGIADFINEITRRKTPPSVPKEFEKPLQDLVKHIIAQWHEQVDADIQAAPFTQAELEAAGGKYRARYEKGEGLHKAYGSTLIAAAITQKYWFGLHIGDGRLTALYADGSRAQPVPWDDKCFLNQTTSICDDDAAERARVSVSFHAGGKAPAAVLLCSDGVDDNYPVDDNERHLFKLYRTIALTFAEDGFESTCAQLKDLAHSFATKGKGDDTSIAGLVNMDEIKRAVPRWKKQIAEEEALAAENAHGGNVQAAPSAAEKAANDNALRKNTSQSFLKSKPLSIALAALLFMAALILGGIAARYTLTRGASKEVNAVEGAQKAKLEDKDEAENTPAPHPVETETDSAAPPVVNTEDGGRNDGQQ